MLRILTFLCFFLASIFSFNITTATAAIDKQYVGSDLRILDLLPNLLIPLAVDPAIPAEFIPLSSSGKLNPYDWVYWGPKDVLKAYFDNPASLKSPVLRVKFSPTVAQTGPNSFSIEESFKMMKKENPRGFSFVKTQWGKYPVVAIRNQKEGQFHFCAWVGLNDPGTGWTLMFNLVYPVETGHPSKEDCQLWENLIMKTTQLKDGDYFKACGQDLQEGYTLVNAGGAKLKIVAEKRQSDKRLQVVVIPEGNDVEFEYIGMMECLMGCEWKYGEPLVKVYGKIKVKNGNVHTTIDHIASIFIKTVPEFSFKKEDSPKLLIFENVAEKTD